MVNVMQMNSLHEVHISLRQGIQLISDTRDIFRK